MQLQSDLTGTAVNACETEELSAIGTAYLAGITAGLYDEKNVFENLAYHCYSPDMAAEHHRINFQKCMADPEVYRAYIKDICHVPEKLCISDFFSFLKLSN